MRYLLLFIFFHLIVDFLNAQLGKNIITELKTINQTVTNKDCNTDAAAISNRAMNVFLAEKLGYLSGHQDDLSLYTNFVTINSAEGKININHNVENPSGIDEPIKKLFSLGASATIANQFAATFLDKSNENELGVTFNYKWLGKIKTHFSNCTIYPNQKQKMDALRAVILHMLELEINRKDTDFKASLNAMDSSEIPGQKLDSTKAIISNQFYADLKDEYEEKFAKQQAAIFTSTNYFKLVHTSWTSLNIYIPVITSKYAVAHSYIASFQNKHSYPLDITLSYTHLWESSTAGRMFVTISGDMFLNNTKLGYGLDKTNYSDYKINGGKDTSYLNELKNNRAFIGDYQSFVTPAIKGRFVYYPSNTHFGIGFSIEQSFGKYSPLNGKITVPIVLINSNKLPAVNFNLDIMFLDITNNYIAVKKSGGKTFIGLEIGIPFSRLIF